jgi:hypothetical protein
MATSIKSVEWDVFLSYASEDREEIAQPLAVVLQDCGVRVWYDRVELQLGDSLRRKIDEGLACCRYGIVILSPAFFSKYYPNRELDGLAQREIEGKKVLLPVWHKVSEAQVRSFSPPLADRIAARSDEGVMAVAHQVLRIVRTDLTPEHLQQVRSLPQQPETSDSLPQASPDRPPTPTLRSLQIHRLVTLTAWSMLASLVVVMSTRITGFYLVALGPLWVSAGGFAAARIASGNRPSAIVLGGLLCGLFGAWLGSVGDGDTGIQLGLVWGSMAGGLAASYFASWKAYMSFLSSLTSTAIFFGLTVAILGSSITFILENPTGFVRTGFSFLTYEAMLLLTGYLLWAVLKKFGEQLKARTR